jgi:hypothetical protein
MAKFAATALLLACAIWACTGQGEDYQSFDFGAFNLL